MEIEVREAGAKDVPFLWQMLAYAASMDGSEDSVAFAREDAYLRRYVEGWGRAGDVGVIGRRGDERVGAAWIRMLEDDVPELAIATVPGVRGAGVGSALLAALVERGRAGRIGGIVLSVREENPALRLYERLGFVAVRRVTNRVGTHSVAMRLDLRGPE